jgi:MerR family transcriptional regulator, copper efflux regulator
MSSISIGQVAKKAGVSVETIRFYESKGLIEKPERKESGYRQYLPNVVIRLQFIQQAKQLGFTLNEIQELLSLRADTEAGCQDIRSVGASKLHEVEEKIVALRKIQRALKQLVDDCPGKGSKSACPILDALDAQK